MNRNIVFDMDGVLSDFEGYFCRKFGFEHRNKIKLEERYPDFVKEIDSFVASAYTYESLDVISLGLEIIRYIDSLKNFDICIVSSRPEYCTTITAKWLKQNEIPYISLSVGSDKIKRIMKLNPVFALDDLGEVGEKLQQIGIPTILISSPWNKSFEGNLPRISDFEMFLSQFDRILNVSKLRLSFA